MRDIDDVTADVLHIALRLHRDLGPGLLESVYETLLAGRLQTMGYQVEPQRMIGATFEGVHFEAANFGREMLKEGVKRVVNDYSPSAPPSSSPRLRVNKSFGV